MSDLPSGWTRVSVSDIAEVTLGQSPAGRSYNREGHGVPFFQGKKEFGEASPVVEQWTTQPKKHAEPGDILVSVRAPVGATNIADRHCSIGRGLAALRPSPATSTKYLLWAVKRFEDDLASLGTGTTFTAISGKVLRSFRLPLPPLAEQERIVSAIEAHFSHLDAAEASLDRGRLGLARLRRSILMGVGTGEWPKERLGDIATTVRNGMFVSRPASHPPGLPIFRISAVRSLALDVADVRYADVSERDAALFRVEEGDLLFTRYSGNPSYVGACAVVPSGGAGTIHPDKLIRVVADPSIVLPLWIAMCVSVGEGRAQIDARLKTTAGQVGIAGGQLKTVEIPLPPVEEQARRIAYWKAATERMSALSADIERSTWRASSLRRSVLSDAFAGRLLAQDPTDEPASALLHRTSDAAPGISTSRERKHT